MKTVQIKSFNGIGDLLFVTPTLRRIKEKYRDDVEVIVNTNYPQLLEGNPFVDKINVSKNGLFLGYPDPIHRKLPTKHHIVSDWEIVRDRFSLDIDFPDLKPEIYLDLPETKTDVVGVQVLHKCHWNAKKVWPKFGELVRIADGCLYNIKPIPLFSDVRNLVRFVASCKAVVCAEGGISHIAKAVGTTAIVVYGGFAKPEWNGYENQINLCNDKWCSYCYNPDPCINEIDRLCMLEITVSDVLLAIEGLDKIKRLSYGNAKKSIEKDALRWCRGKGVDVGAGHWCLPGARPIDLGPEEDAYCIGEADESLDFVFSSHCLEHLDEPSRALSEWYRVLKKGGILYLYLPHPDYLPWRRASMPKWHKFDVRKQLLVKLLRDFEIIEYVEKDENFGVKVIARK